MYPNLCHLSEQENSSAENAKFHLQSEQENSSAENVKNHLINMKDLTNIKNREKKHSTENEERSFYGLFVQDLQLCERFSTYLKILVLDATYKLSELHFQMYLSVLHDANGGG